MAINKKHQIDNKEMLACKKALKAMVASSAYYTEATYSTNSELYPDNLMPFVDKHMHYLRSHPTIDPERYLSNLRLMTRVR
jgi:hypothetical protein